VIDYLATYTAAGIAVMPLHGVRNGACTCKAGASCERSPAKHPRTPNGKDDATTDLGIIGSWITRYPGCNWGGRPPVGQFVLDVDPRNGGLDTLAALELEHGPLPRTRTQRTGSGGLHFWWSYDGPVLGKLGQGLDIKSNSGYLVLAPSLHISGGRYEFIDRSPVAPAPAWMIEKLTPRARVLTGESAGLAPLVRRVMTAPQGERNNLLFWAARCAADEGLTLAPLRDAALYVGLTPQEIDATIGSATRSRTGA
jgi:hypothetical protein